MVLFAWFQLGEVSQCFRQQVCSHFSKSQHQFRRSFGGADRSAALKKEWTRIQFRFNNHCRHTGFALSVHNRPVNWRGATVFWQQREMHVHATVLRSLQKCLGKDTTVSDNDGEICFRFAIKLWR